MENELLRRLPFSMEAEQSVLGSILIRPAESIEAIAGIISVDDFYMEEHQLIYSAMLDMFMSSKVIDTVTLVNRLVESGKRDEIGGTNYISHIIEMVPTAANVRDYAVIVHNKAMLRKLITACDDISGMAYSEEGEVSDIVDSAEQRIFEIAEQKGSHEFRHISDVVASVYKNYVHLFENKNQPEGIKSGFSGLDQVLVQMGKGDFILIGARPGMGKTSFALNIALNVAKSSKKTVCIFSLEMSAEQLVNRLMSTEAMVDSLSLRSGEIADDAWTRLADAASELAGVDILIDDTTSISTTDMKAKLRRVKNLGLVIIDYLGLMQSARKIENRTQEISDITRALKVMAKELGVPVICCAQLSRNTETRGKGERRPMLSDLRDSGSIEQDADVVLFLYRSTYYGDEGSDGDASGDSTVEVIIAKNRHGAVGTVKMGWIPQFTKFVTRDFTPGQ